MTVTFINLRLLSVTNIHNKSITTRFVYVLNNKKVHRTPCTLPKYSYIKCPLSTNLIERINVLVPICQFDNLSISLPTPKARKMRSPSRRRKLVTAPGWLRWWSVYCPHDFRLPHGPAFPPPPPRQVSPYSASVSTWWLRTGHYLHLVGSPCLRVSLFLYQYHSGSWRSSKDASGFNIQDFEDNSFAV